MMKVNNVNNVPTYALDLPVWVARLVDGELWFWGAYDGYSDAFFAADQIDGQVVINE